jgi:ribosome recycling factor
MAPPLAAAGNLRIGRIMPGLVSGLHVRTADGDFKLEALGDISVKGASTLVVALHDASHGASVVQAVEAKLAGYVTTADEATVTILAPKVTKELRSAMVKQAKEKAEEVCIGLFYLTPTHVFAQSRIICT